MDFSNYISGRWVLNNKTIIYRVLRGFLRAMLLQKNTLKIIELFPTFNCPSACSMCSVEKYKHRNDTILGLDDYRKIAKDGARMGAIAMTVLGGEPFLYEHLAELIAIFRKEKYFCNIVTGGTLVSREKLDELKHVGVGSIFFSLESMDKKRNDDIRGKGHLKKTMENLEWCRELKINAGLATLFAPDRMSDAREVIKYTRAKGLLATASQVAAAGLSETALLLSKEQNDIVRRMVREYPHLTLDWTMSYFFRQQCPAGKEKIGVTCHGDVIGCSINSISFGNIKDESLDIIWERMGHFSQFALNSPLCLAAENQEYITKYLSPLKNVTTYPLSYSRHPLMSPALEPRLYKQER